MEPTPTLARLSKLAIVPFLIWIEGIHLEISIPRMKENAINFMNSHVIDLRR